MSIPRTIYSTWKSKTHLDSKKKACVHSIRKANKNFRHIIHDDTDCENFVREHYPQYYDLYNDLELPVQKADFWRYLIIYHYGGWYCDMDIKAYWSFDQIKIPKEYRGGDLMIVEMENPTPFNTGKSCPRLPQYAQYWFGATPKHPVLKKVIKRVVGHLKRKEDYRKCDDDETLYLTGPVPFTDAIQRHRTKENVYVLEPNFWFMLSKPLHHFSWLFSRHSTVPVLHYCDGSWRNDDGPNFDVIEVLVYTSILGVLLILFLWWFTNRCK